MQSSDVSKQPNSDEVRLQLQVSYVEVACNIVAFCRTLITKSGLGSSNLYRILFGPSLVEALSRSDPFGIDSYQASIRFNY